MGYIKDVTLFGCKWTQIRLHKKLHKMLILNTLCLCAELVLVTVTDTSEKYFFPPKQNFACVVNKEINDQRCGCVHGI